MIRLREIKINILNKDSNILLKKIEEKINKNNIIEYKINKRSIDARNKKEIFYVYEIDVLVKDESKVNLSTNVVSIQNNEYNFIPSGTTKLNHRPIIVGMGPAGLFAAYNLAKSGYNPLIIERGERIEDRVKTVEHFWSTNELNENSNVQFGEGGAGTFSDGKLNSQVKDKEGRCKEVLNTFAKFGAPDEITYDYMPHIGTDNLRKVIINIRNEMIKMGAEFRYNTTLTDIIVNNNKIEQIEVNNNELIDCEVLLIALGHSARDTFYMLNKRGVIMHNKPFAVGLRIMHDEKLISKNQYGDLYKELKPASYKLTNNINGRGVYSFCMCPGGYVVNASSINNHLAINGMSYYNRDSGVSNSAIVVTINESDYGTNLFDGVKYQEELERASYELGSSLIPIQKLEDYHNNRVTNNYQKLICIKGNYNFANLNKLFNNDINNSIKESLKVFDKKIKGFNSPDALLAGIESRTSSPIRIDRDEFGVSNIKGIYPVGEGAGFAGGITSAAIDGIRAYEQVASIYKSFTL